MRTILLFLLVLVIFTTTTTTAVQKRVSLAQRLGYSATDKVLIINADDYGMCHSENLGTEEVLEYGLVKGATMMMPCSWIPEAVSYIKSKNLTNIGIHTTLTSEWRNYRWGPLTGSINSTLINQKEGGYMWRTSEEVERFTDLMEVHEEINFQIKRALKDGIDLSHFDNHMGSIYGIISGRLDLLAVALSNSYEFGLPFRLPYMPGLEVFENMGFAILDYLVTGQRIPMEFNERKAWYINLIKNLKPGVTELYIHPAVESEELKHITSAWRGRVYDTKIFCDDDVKKVIEESGIKLINFEPLKRYQREKMKWNSSFRASQVLSLYRQILRRVNFTKPHQQ